MKFGQFQPPKRWFQVFLPINFIFDVLSILTFSFEGKHSSIKLLSYSQKFREYHLLSQWVLTLLPYTVLFWGPQVLFALRMFAELKSLL